jgi:hypothetical protein
MKNTVSPQHWSILLLSPLTPDMIGNTLKELQSREDVVVVRFTDHKFLACMGVLGVQTLLIVRRTYYRERSA